jgi:hypothetical protein
VGCPGSTGVMRRASPPWPSVEESLFAAADATVSIYADASHASGTELIGTRERVRQNPTTPVCENGTATPDHPPV